MTSLSNNSVDSNGPSWRLIGWAAAAALLCLPWVAMQFTDEVNWERSDFVIFGAMLLVAGLSLEVASRISVNRTYRVAAGVTIAGAFFLFWSNGAVGVIGNENNPANLLYVAVFGVIVLGALLSRLGARGMSIALFLAALAQILVPLVAWLARIGPAEALARPGVWIITAMFVAIWIAAALLFRTAARDTF